MGDVVCWAHENGRVEERTVTSLSGVPWAAGWSCSSRMIRYWDATTDQHKTSASPIPHTPFSMARYMYNMPRES